MIGVDFRGVGVEFAAGLADVSVGPRSVLSGLNLHVAPGEIVAVVGRSGCGKTTLLNLAAGLLRPQAGEVSFSAAPHTGYVFQDARLLPWLTLEQNLSFVAPDAPHASIQAELARVGLAGRGRDYPRQVSLGMAQRAAVARALLIRPNLLLLDEPFGALDELTAAELRNELAELLLSSRASTLLVTHNPAEAVLLADRVVALDGAPARIRGEVVVALSRPRDPQSTELGPYVRELRALLSEGAV